jgi:hypothetical protein
MNDPEALRNKAKKCRQLAGMAGDEEIERELNALADQYEARAMKAQAGDSTDSR